MAEWAMAYGQFLESELKHYSLFMHACIHSNIQSAIYWTLILGQALAHPGKGSRMKERGKDVIVPTRGIFPNL